MRLRSMIIVALLLSSFQTSWADKDKARDFFKRGMAEFVLERYDVAIPLFENGFREEADPIFLFNIAQSHRLSRRPVEAISFYRKYLKMQPEAVNRKEVEQQIAALEKTISQPKRTDMAAGSVAGGKVGTAHPATAPASTTAPATATAPVAATPQPTSPAQVQETTNTTPVAAEAATSTSATSLPAAATTAGPTKSAPRKTWPIWVGVAAGVVVAGLAVGLGVGLSQGGSSEPTYSWSAR